MIDAAEPAVVVCDANVLYSIVMTDLILSLGSAELFYPRWTDRIHGEWMRNLLADRPDLDPAKVERRRRQMDAAIDDCLILGYQDLIPSLSLPDNDDLHVLAAAIHGKAKVIVTCNLRHFPKKNLAPFGITAMHPDNFLTALTDRHEDEVKEVLEEMRSRKTRPPISGEDMLRKIENQPLPQFVAKLRAIGYGVDPV
ncbi:MAG: PIN domain-containing protein [Blastocatellia bacterium]|nr:PIN domain-containing protein [Blastocatellia bacterium]